jgi:hypothetical protein
MEKKERIILAGKYFQDSVLPSGCAVDPVERDSVTIRNGDEVNKVDLNWM